MPRQVKTVKEQLLSGCDYFPELAFCARFVFHDEQTGCYSVVLYSLISNFPPPPHPQQKAI